MSISHRKEAIVPLIVEYRNGQKEAIRGETLRDYELINSHGKILAITVPEGRNKIIYREDVRAVEELPLAAWNKMIEDENKAREEKAAKEKADVDAKAEAGKKAEADRQAAIEARKFKNKIKRLFRRNP